MAQTHTCCVHCFLCALVLKTVPEVAGMQKNLVISAAKTRCVCGLFQEMVEVAVVGMIRCLRLHFCVLPLPVHFARAPYACHVLHSSIAILQGIARPILAMLLFQQLQRHLSLESGDCRH
jgi:hypothetical protein